MLLGRRREGFVWQDRILGREGGDPGRDGWAREAWGGQGRGELVRPLHGSGGGPGVKEKAPQARSLPDYLEPALRAHIPPYSAKRPLEFFAEVDARDPEVLLTHSYHWFDLARMEHVDVHV